MSGITGDSEAAKVYTKGMIDSGSLEKHERVRFDLIIFQMQRVIETIFYEYRAGLVTEELWEGQWRGVLSMLETEGGRESWKRQKHFESKSFMEWVDGQLDPV